MSEQHEALLQQNPRQKPKVKVTNNLLKIRYKQEIYKQKDLAVLLGATQQSVGQWERNDVQPSIATALKICAKLGVTIEEFFNFEDS